MLKIDLKVGDSIRVGDYATITLEDKSGKIARLSINADKSIPVSREQRQTPPQVAARVGISGKQ